MISAIHIRELLRTRGLRAACFEARAAWRAGCTGNRFGMLTVEQRDDQATLIQWLIYDYLEAARDNQEKHTCQISPKYDWRTKP